MFHNCASLKELNITNFNTNEVIKNNQYYIFSYCSDELKAKIKEQYNIFKDEAFSDF